MNLRLRLKSLWNLLTKKKPNILSRRDYLSIILVPIRYQPLLLPDGTVIEKQCCDAILDSREKLASLELPEDLSGKTFLDIGCAEGFFVIQAARRGAVFARGCDFTAERIKIAKILAKAWNLEDKVEFSTVGLYDIPPEHAADIVTCLSVCHHLHGGNHDTWQIISNPEKYAKAFDCMLQAISAVAALTNEITYWEYCFEYSGDKPLAVDFAKLGRIWEERAIYQRVEFKGLSQSSGTKDRAIYHAYK